MTPAAMLHGFAYGEHLDGLPPRSLGFRLLAPLEAEPWSLAVETLARGLQAAPYPDAWPPTDLFCSVLLSDGQRLVALARYGLADHTPSRRRGGLELIGVVGPGNLGVPTALAIYHWLRQRRGSSDDLRALGGRVPLANVLADMPPAPPATDPVPVLPIRLWQQGALLFAATSPSDPDRRLGLLDQGAGETWQWLPLIGPDWPLQDYARRGPLVAWTPHLAGVAVKLDRPAADPIPRPTRGRSMVLGIIGLLVAGLLAANLWASLATRRQMEAALRAPPPSPVESRPPADPPAADSRERFAQALHRLLQRPSAKRDWTPNQLNAQYERLAASDEDLRLTGQDGKLAVGQVGLLLKRRPGQIEEQVREALTNRGFDPELIEVACKRVHEQLISGTGDGP